MKVLLIEPPQAGKNITRNMAAGFGFDASSQTRLPPLDLALLAAELKRKRNEILLIDSDMENLSLQEIVRRIQEFNPEVIIPSVSLPSLIADSNFIKEVKNKTDAIIFARTSISFKPILKEILVRSKADYCLFGEVELEIDKIIKGKSKKGTARLRKKELLVDKIELIKNLDLLPFPARDLLKNQKYQYPLLGSNCSIIQTSRGCPFACAYYCPYPLIQGHKWRAMSSGRVYMELADIVRRHKIKKVLFRDATFSLDKKRTIEICQKIMEKKLHFSWWCETRVNCLDEEILKIMRKSGCRGINIGVETGDNFVMEKQGKPGVDINQLIALKKTADRVGMKLHFLILIGLPQETRCSLYSTFKLVKKLNPYSLGVTTITPYPGTKLYEEAVGKNWIETQEWSKYRGNLATMHTDNLTSRQIKIAQRLIQGELFLLKKGLWGKIGLFIEDIFFRIWAKIW